MKRKSLAKTPTVLAAITAAAIMSSPLMCEAEENESVVLEEKNELADVEAFAGTFTEVDLIEEQIPEESEILYVPEDIFSEEEQISTIENEPLETEEISIEKCI